MILTINEYTDRIKKTYASFIRANRMTKRYNEIINNKEYRKLLMEVEDLEENREYCRHGLEHLLDVARISYIMILEDGADISKDIIYAASLFHDIGRGKSYQSGGNHDKVSADIAKKLLPDYGYNNDEVNQICDAIVSHSGRVNIEEFKKKRQDKIKLSIADYLKVSDQLSRNCFSCKVSDNCKWNEEEKNTNIKI